MAWRNLRRALGFSLVFACAGALGGCGGFPLGYERLTARDCMTRVMYFESNRSSYEGMLAVGTVVMNRLASPQFPKTVCGVVGQPRQFAPGVLTLPMRPDEAARIARVADEVLAGARDPRVQDAMFFHTAGLTFPYTNMHYVLVAGGNAFYEKIPSRRAYAERRERPRTIGDLISFATLGLL